jgi:hypothetical protein
MPASIRLSFSSCLIPHIAERLVCLGRLTPESLEPQSPHLGTVPRFLMCSTRSSPPGVRTVRVMLEDVFHLGAWLVPDRKAESKV